VSDERQVIEADLTWTGARFERGVRVVVDPAGTIEQVTSDPVEPTRRLSRRALLPGMVNAHSHAFQRGLRGRGERFPEGAGSFWTWRESMYGLVEQMDEQRIHALSRQAFSEMLAAGVTTVGEFHYLHHDATCRGFAFDEVVLHAARETGIRIVLLNAYYRTGGVGEPLRGGQRRFETTDPDAYWAQMDRLASMLDPATQSLGAVAHSIRAAPLEDFVAIHQESNRRGIPFHVHVEEQRKEIDQCLDRYGKTPMAMLNESLDIDARFTAVHCTHTDPGDMRAFLDAGGNVCICPLTEANLGDGIANVPGILDAGGRICLGTDSNARLSFTEEMRWLEYVQRLAGNRRGVCTAGGGSDGNVARELWSMATTHGARALRIDAGAIEPGLAADFCTIDLDAQSLEGWDQETLLDAFILGTGNEAIREACVGGRWIDLQRTGDVRQ